MFIIFIISIIFLFGFLFLPIGYLNEEIIVLFPLFTDQLSNSEIWEWQNTAAFVITYFISVVLLIYFRSTQQNLGIGIGYVINIVSILILFTIVWMMEIALSSEFTFSYGYGWLIWLTGSILFFISIYKKPAAS